MQKLAQADTADNWAQTETVKAWALKRHGHRQAVV